MQIFTGTRIAIVAAAAIFIAFLVMGASMGMFGDMFTPFFGSLGNATGLTGTPAAGTSGTSSTSSRPAATATIRR